MPAGEAALALALRPWERRLTIEAIERWLIRGVTVCLVLASLVLLVGWVTPYPERELQPLAAQIALPPLLLALILGLWPARRLRQAAALDSRLGFGDRLATAWAFRLASEPIVELQRSDAIAHLQQLSPVDALKWRPSRLDALLLGAAATITVLLLVVPSPQQPVLERRAAEQLAVQRAAERLEALRVETAASSTSLSPEQARQLDELLRQAQAELSHVKTQKEASTIVARTEQQVSQQLSDPNSELRDEALAAMSETLAAEPLTRQLSEAIQHEDAQATSEALKALAAQTDQLADVQRQALSRALQRAANVGRADPRSASAMRDAARSIGTGESSEAALSATDAALREAIQAATAQAALRLASQRLRDLEAQLAAGGSLTGTDESDQNAAGAGQQTGVPQSGAALAGTPVALDSSSGALARLNEPAADRGTGAGVGPGAQTNGTGAAQQSSAAENVFVPGREGTGPADLDKNLTEQPFTLRGAPRPYRDVLSQYAASGRDYVDRPDISPAVRDLVKQYFQDLEQGQ